MGRERRSKPFRVLVFFTARAELNPRERPREPPGARPASGGRVHFAAQTRQLVTRWARLLSFRGERLEVWEGDAISQRGRAGCELSMVWRDVAGWSREASTWRPEVLPSPSPLRLLSVVQSPPVLPRLGLIVREAATARGLPHPGTTAGGRGRWAGGNGGGRGRNDVGGRGCPTFGSGR